ncbi:Ca-activated chloride channel family protein [Hymenobacter daecheongensis DSM 21074]|uniref:Ca-activated chloride channel family protein n=1 Tax=Hymenobacter daecheongensis DSM 21074 TaxID=1121955 RepID=A0A1M6EDY6_9BACT|nr:VWA domain-containing protein [Hymenobacter daecheongensis]SHI83641.1 Ca-activated chloride channel family protein [Hymenobacter daecheongensis DSM 21074]
MKWAFPLSWLELSAALLFFGLYLGYALRTRRLAAPLRQKAWRLGWKLGLRLAYFALLLVALLGPAYGVTQQPVRTAGKDVWLLVDLSRSMDAPDVVPTRLQKAKAELTALVSRFQADRIGLIVFAADAFVQCPLTYDQGALQLFISTLQTDLVPVGPTDLAAPLALALARISATPTLAGSPPRATALVLVSDGEDFGESLEPTLRELTRSGARLFAMGVGTLDGARLPRAAGRYVRDAQGRDAVSRLAPLPLRRLAEQTNGQYFELTDRRNEFPLLLNALNRVEGQAEQVRTVSVADNRYRYPLVLALALLLLDVLITVKVIRP